MLELAKTLDSWYNFIHCVQKLSKDIEDILRDPNQTSRNENYNI
jgi:hypothetical protein